MSLRPEDLAKTIDHTLLDPDATPADVDRVCAEAREHHLAAVCVLPPNVSRAAQVLRGCDVKVSALIAARAELADECVRAGAAELDVAMNADAMLAGDIWRIRDELAAVVRVVRLRAVNAGRGRVLVKVEIGCERLDRERQRLACAIAEQVEADFVTAAGPATVDDVELLREHLPERIGLKASGEIRTAEEARELLTAGASRIGTPHGLAIAGGQKELHRAS